MSDTTHIHEDHGTVRTHPDNARHNVVAVLIGLLAITLAITAYSLWAYFTRAAESLTHEIVHSLPSPELQALRAKEEAELAGAAIGDEEIRLSIEKATAVFVREAEERKRAGIPQRIEAVPGAAAEETETP